MIGGRPHWFLTETGAVVLTVLALPLALLVVCALVLWRTRTGTGRSRAWRLSLAEVGVVYGTVPWLWLTLLPGSGAGVVPPRVSLVPLRDLVEILATDPLTATLQIGGNLLIFAALGFFGPLRFPALASLRRILILAATGSILVEVAQYAFHLDRVSSVDDVLLNTTGAVLAALASRHWWRPRQPADPSSTARHPKRPSTTVSRQ